MQDLADKNFETVTIMLKKIFLNMFQKAENLTTTIHQIQNINQEVKCFSKKMEILELERYSERNEKFIGRTQQQI